MAQSEIVATYNAMVQEQQARESKISELDNDKHDHTLVIESLEPLAADRKCYRLINGVLVERTVGEVLPALKSTRDGIAQVIKQITDQYKAKEREMLEFQQKHGDVLQQRGGGGAAPAAASGRSERKQSGQGVLA